MPIRIIASLLIILFSGAAVAETSIQPPDASALYARGKRLLREGDWMSAAQVFEELSGRYADSPDLPLFVFHRAKAEYYIGEYAKAVAGFSFLLSRYPDMPEVPYASFFLGNTYYRRGDVDRALRQYLQAYGASSDERLTRLARESIAALFENAGTVAVGPADFASLSEERRCPLIRQVAEVLVGRDQAQLAGQLLAECGDSLATGVMASGSVGRGHRTLELAVLLPMSGDLQEFGNEIYNGAVIAAQMHREESGGRLSIVPYDTKGDPIDAARIVSELGLGTAQAAIGPLTSEEAAVASARLYRTGLPLLVPAATEAGLTRLSETSFQLSPNIELQGVRMAEYAVDALGASTAAVIGPTSTDQLRQARAFINRFEELGGTVVATEYYRTRDKDFGPYIRDIKGLIHGLVPDSIYYIDSRGDTIDVDGLSASVDCLFLPGRPEQIRLLLPQINFYNLNGRYLGTDGWGDDAIYRLGDNVTKLAVFPSPFLPVRPTDESVAFAAAYDARYGTRPGRLAKLGYDALRLAARAADGGSTSREEITENLRVTAGYRGASGTITFGPHRENVALPLYRIDNGAPVPLGGEAAPAAESTESQ